MFIMRSVHIYLQKRLAKQTYVLAFGNGDGNEPLRIGNMMNLLMALFGDPCYTKHNWKK